MARLASVSLALACAGAPLACAAESVNGEPSGSEGGAGAGGGQSEAGAGGSPSNTMTGGTAGAAASSGRGGSGGTGVAGGSDARGGTTGTAGGAGVSAGNGEVAGSGGVANEPSNAGEGGNTDGTPGAGGAPGAAGDESGGTAGSGGAGIMIPSCDIYAAAGVPCVGAYSMVRVLSSNYTGPLYQVRRGGPIPNFNEGGETQDIGATEHGFGDAAAQDAFCSEQTCTVSILYDQSGKGNHLRAGIESCYQSSNPPKAYEAEAGRYRLTVRGHPVYALFTDKREAYRNNEAVDTPEGEAEQGVYMVADGTRAGAMCCWDFGTGSRDNCPATLGTTNTLFFGSATYWGTGNGSGPWFMADFEGGVWAGGTEGSQTVNQESPSLLVPFAFGILKTSARSYTLRVGDVKQGNLATAWDGGIPIPNWSMEGAIMLGMGNDVSVSSQGVFFEGVITAGRPSDETDEAVYRSVRAVGYGE